MRYILRYILTMIYDICKGLYNQKLRKNDILYRFIIIIVKSN